MSNFTKSLDESITHFDKWLYLIRHLSTLKTVPAALQHNIFKRTFDMAKIGEMTREEYLEFHKDTTKYYDFTSMEISNQEHGKELERIKMVKNIYESGFSPEDIARMTKLELKVVLSYLGLDKK
jgi:hypothetical protein